MKINELLGEAVADTKDAIALSNAIVDYLVNNNITKPGTKIDLTSIPNLPKMTSQEAQTLIDAVRIIVVDPERVWGKGANVGADAASYYRDPQGNYVDQAYKDARTSKDVRAGKMAPLIAPNDPVWKDLVASQGRAGNKMDIRIPFDKLTYETKRGLASIMSHEISHVLDTIKGAHNSKDWEKVQDHKDADAKLQKHREAQKLITPENPRPEGLLDPAEEKRLIKILKSNPGTYAPTGSIGYYARQTEVNARLVQTAGTMAEWAPKLFQTKHDIGEVTKWALSQNSVAHAFIKWPDEATFRKSLRSLTPEQWKEAFANPEFKKVYNRLYKFVADESVAGGFIAQAQKDNFRTWNKAIVGQSLKDKFVEKFKQVVIFGLQAAADTVKQAAQRATANVRLVQNGFADLERIIIKKLPAFLVKAGVKSIPLVGILFGVAFAIPRLIKGDAPGAGLEVASSVGGLATVIPTVAYQMSRDLYNEVYEYEDGKPAVFEYDMAKDPEGTKQRVKELTDMISNLLNKNLKKNAPSFPQAFQDTQDGAALGNPMIAKQASKTRAQRDQSPVRDIAFESMLRIAGLR